MNYAGKLIVSVARTSDNLKRPCKARLFFLILFRYSYGPVFLVTSLLP